jgi:hypothetical protein
MKMYPLWPAIACFALWSLPAYAVDLSKIDRRIVKEPAYQTKTPKYCLLVFGPEAKHRVWLVMDGDRLYVDKSGTGDLTDESGWVKAPAFEASSHPAHERERSIAVGDVTIDGLTHTELTVSQTQYRRKVEVSRGVGALRPEVWQEYLDSIWRKVPDGLVYMVTINLEPTCYGRFEASKGRRVLHFAWSDRQGQLVFADRPKDAPIIHFGGPLTLTHHPVEKLPRGGDSGKTTLRLGASGLGAGTFVTMNFGLIPEDVHPSVEIRFPPKELGQPPVTKKYVLKERC